MLKKTAITLVIVSPIVLFAVEVLYPWPRTAPPQEVVASWETEAETRVGEFRVSFALHEDGIVQGTVGDATMQNAYFRRNRTLLFRMLGMATDHIIVGNLEGSVIGEIQCAEFWIIGHFDEKGITADFDCDRCTKDGEKLYRFGDGPLVYTRVELP
jgi:hypothetical protein